MIEHNDVDQVLLGAYQSLAEDVRDRTDMGEIKASLYTRMRKQRPLAGQITDTYAARSQGERPQAGVRFLTVAEVSAMLRVSKMEVFRLVHSGELPAVRVGRSFRIPEQAVHDYLDNMFGNIEVG